RRTTRVIDDQRQRLARLEATAGNADLMGEDAVEFLRIGDGGRNALAVDDADIADLAAAFAIEGRLVEHDKTVLARCESSDFLAILEQSLDLAFGSFGLVAEEFGGAKFVRQAVPHGIGGRFARARPAL